MKMTLAEWLSEREANARQIAASKHGIDKADWLEDAEYFKEAAALAAPSTLLSDEQIDEVFARGGFDGPIGFARLILALAAPSTPAAPTQCACGVPWTLGVVHRAKNPCFIYIEPAAQSAMDVLATLEGMLVELLPEDSPGQPTVAAACSTIRRIIK